MHRYIRKSLFSLDKKKVKFNVKFQVLHSFSCYPYDFLTVTPGLNCSDLFAQTNSYLLVLFVYIIEFMTSEMKYVGLANILRDYISRL